PLTCLPAHTGVFQWVGKAECHFINGMDWVRFMERHIYNREQLLHFDSYVGHYLGDTLYGEKVAKYLNSRLEWMEYKGTVVDRHCRHNYKLDALFLMDC
ncbi:HB2L protein, partial [Atrichornis clamosus]|nr:HB2L protein [Atrichornis clamosus]